MKYKVWNKGNGNEFFEIIEPSGFAIGQAFNENAAKLFTAAPDMLAVLKHLLTENEGHGEHGDMEQRSLLLATIAAAEGGTK
jgi:hypothetical protein